MCCRGFAAAPYSVATYDRLVQYTRARHLTQPLPSDGDADAGTACRGVAETGASAPRQRASRWDMRERRRRSPVDPCRDVIDLTEQTPPRSPVTTAEDAAAASTSPSASGRSSSPPPDSRDGLRQRLHESDSADEPRRSSKSDVDQQQRRSNRGSRPSHRRRSPDRHRGRRSRRRFLSQSRSRSRSPVRSRNEETAAHGRRSSKAEQRRARSSTDASCADGPSGPPIGRDAGRLQHNYVAVHEHDLAAAELRRLRQRALQGMPSAHAQPEASLMHGPSDDDRWEMA